jgi:hypothetical protein
MMKAAMLAGVALFGLALAACGEGPAAVPAQNAQLANVIPAGGSTGVDPSSPIVVEFTHGMMAGMEGYIALHQGTVAGPTVAGTWAWNATRTRATFTPAAALAGAAPYLVHIGGRMMDLGGNVVGFEDHAEHHGGQWATSSMMNTAMMGAGMGMGSGHEAMMGEGWQHANGSWGMIFPFTTR